MPIKVFPPNTNEERYLGAILERLESIEARLQEVSAAIIAVSALSSGATSRD